MSRKRKHGGGGGQNFWPGYVDALTNVVLNLLFMVAIFGIALTLFNSIPRSTGPAHPEGPGLYALGVPAQPPAAERAESGEAAQSASARGSSARNSSARSASARSASAPAPRVASATQRDGEVASEGHVAVADPVHAVSRSAESARSETAHAEVPTHFEADQVAIVVADSYSRRGGPEPRLVKGIDSAGRTLITLEVPDSADPLALSRGSIAGALRESIPRAADQRLVMWTVTDRDDPARLRGAYVALAAMRNQLIAAGWPAGAIDVRLQPGTTRAANGLRVFITAVASDITP